MRSTISVARTTIPASAQDVDGLLTSLDTRPGAWLGCDVASDGLFRRESMACAVAALRFCLDGVTLTATALTPCGAGLLEAFGSNGGTFNSGATVLAELRRFLSMFDSPSAEMGLYGAFSFDYYLLGEEKLPDDGRRRLVLHFPERVLAVDAAGARWIDFVFSSEHRGAVGQIPQVCIEEDEDELPAGGHAKRVAGGIERLRRGELQSLVLSQTFRRRSSVAPSRAFAALRARNPYPAMFFCNLGGGEVLFGASPDLQVRADSEWVESAPVCGTLRRGGDPIEDAAQALALLASEKEGAALALCADAAANEHAVVCVPGTVEVLSHRRAYFFSTIIHAIDHLRGRRRAGLDAFDLLLAHATPATVTGLPKRAALRAIAELEADWRGWYAGAVARLGSDGSITAHTVLRAARVAGGIAEIRTGGNILVDSNPEKEEDESRLKAQSLFSVLEAADSTPLSAAPRARLYRFVESDDDVLPRLENALATAGATRAHEAQMSILSGVPAKPASIQEPLLALGEGALWLLGEAGAVVAVLVRPEFARIVEGRASQNGFLGVVGAFSAGWYSTRAIRSGTLPAPWMESAVSEEGWILAAQHREHRICALLFRPDSVLSLRGAAGMRALHAAFAWLDHGMFARESEKENA
ncbi:MAG: chorismate-binding protein [Candidatus Parcubacteria bacterium]|nr:chorismate-binding protein [Burkholderiales bacterium]